MDPPEESKERVANKEAVPCSAMLDAWSQSAWTNGAQIDELEDMQRIHVRTVYSLYEITVIDGRSGEILIKGGQYVPDLTEGHLAGATLGGSFCKMRGIYPGFRMEFVVHGQRFITSTVKTVSVFPADFL